MNEGKVMQFFREILRIPRESGHEEHIIEYLLEFGRSRGLDTKRDTIGNVLITKPAANGCEKWPTVVLQSHQDMVCEKNGGVKHDFAKDPIKAYEKDGWLKAEGTTLGADDGIGIASELAILDDASLKLGKIVTDYPKSFDNGEEMISGKPYWFKVEPIEWTVLNFKNGDYTLVSDRLLEQTNFDNHGGSRIIDTKTIYENNYEYSSIRDWLNSSFENKLFFLNTGTDYHVIDTVVDNSAKTTGSEWKDFACNNTIDKVFLPSVLDTKLIEEKYGNYASLTTDYLRASGTYYNYQTMPYCAEYWTRSPDRGLVGPGSDPTFKDLVQFVSQKGDQGRCSASLVHNVRPCITIKVI